MNPLALFHRQRQPVIYEVRLEVDTAILEDFDEWLLLHVREMLALPGFQSASIYHARALTENGRAVRLVAYEVRGRRELASYMHTYAPGMRKQGVTRFGTQFAATRRTVPVADYVVPEGFSMLLDRNAISGGLPICGNCHQPVSGRYCANCGQEDRTLMLSLGELAYEFVGDTFNFDSRLFRTSLPLLFKPGLLTAEYVRGKRQVYLPPVRMYIFISLVFFFFAALLTDLNFNETFVFDDEEDEPVVVTPSRALTPEERSAAERALREAATAAGLADDALQLDESPETGPQGEQAAGDPADRKGIEFSGFGEAGFEERLERGAESLSDDPKAFAQAMMQQVPTMMFVFLPLIALVLKLIYIGSGRYYVEHLIFTLHFHSAVFVLLLLWLLFGELQERVALLEPLSGWVTAAVSIYIPVYLYRAMRCVYAQGHFFTTLKYVFLLFAYISASTATLVITLIYTLYAQS